jgi:hypothetical protein
MPRQKTGGRRKGSTNKINNDLRGKISIFLDGEFDNVRKAFKDASLQPRDRIKLYCELLQYGLPKLQAVNNTIDFENLTDDQLEKLVNHLIQAHG